MLKISRYAAALFVILVLAVLFKLPLPRYEWHAATGLAKWCREDRWTGTLTCGWWREQWGRWVSDQERAGATSPDGP